MSQDLKGSQIAAVMDQFFDKLAQGNEGTSDIEVLERGGSVIHFKVRIRHRHVWVIRLPSGGKQKVTAYDLTTWAEGKFDALNPVTSDLEVCTDSPVGKICLSLRDIIAIIVAML